MVRPLEKTYLKKKFFAAKIEKVYLMPLLTIITSTEEYFKRTTINNFFFCLLKNFDFGFPITSLTT